MANYSKQVEELLAQFEAGRTDWKIPQREILKQLISHNLSPSELIQLIPNVKVSEVWFDLLSFVDYEWYPQIFLQSLEHPDWRIRRNSAYGLMYLRDEAHLPALAKALEKETEIYAANGMICCIASFGKQTLPYLEAKFASSVDSYLRTIILDAIRPFGDAALPIYIQSLSDEEIIRLTALRNLGQFAEQALPHILPLLQIEDKWTKVFVIRAIAPLGDNVETHILAELHNPVYDIRGAALAALSYWGERALPYALEALSDNSEFIQDIALGILEPYANLIQDQLMAYQQKSQGYMLYRVEDILINLGRLPPPKPDEDKQPEDIAYEIINNLVAELSHTGGEREEAIETLSNYLHLILPQFIKLKDDPSANIRSKVTSVMKHLGTFGLPYLKVAISDEYFQNGEWAFFSLIRNLYQPSDKHDSYYEELFFKAQSSNTF